MKFTRLAYLFACISTTLALPQGSPGMGDSPPLTGVLNADLCPKVQAQQLSVQCDSGIDNIISAVYEAGNRKWDENDEEAAQTLWDLGAEIEWFKNHKSQQ